MLLKSQIWSGTASAKKRFKKSGGLILKIVFAFVTLAIFSSQNALAEPKSQKVGYSKDSPFDLPIFDPAKLGFQVEGGYKKSNVPPAKPSNDRDLPNYTTSSAKKSANSPKNVKMKPKEYSKPLSLREEYEPKFYERRKLENIIDQVVEEEVSSPKSLRKERPTVTNKTSAPQPKQNWADLVEEVVEQEFSSPKGIPAKPWYKGRKRKARIVIDPGHGGKDPGAVGKLGTYEKDITLSYSKALKAELERTGRYTVILTRSNDTYVGLQARVNKARWADGDILISVHADSIKNPNVRGFSIYTISQNRASREATKLLRKSDKQEVIRGVKLKGESTDVKEAIIDFVQSETKNVSDSFSEILAKHLKKKTKPLRNTNREASFAVLTGADIPSVLIELGYLSNRYEERLLRDNNHRVKLVRSIRGAIDEYFERYSFLLE